MCAFACLYEAKCKNKVTSDAHINTLFLFRLQVQTHKTQRITVTYTQVFPVQFKLPDNNLLCKAECRVWM